MNFNTHSDLAGRHAILSASQSHWLRYEDEKVKQKIHSRYAALRGTELHDVAKTLIRLRLKQPKTTASFNMYVNDAIGFNMTPEQLLFYSYNAFGTADAISFGPNYHVDRNKNLLRIHDLKTGEGATKMEQLYVYGAYFCLEYGVDPLTIDFEFRIYQYDERNILIADPEQVKFVMERTVHCDMLVSEALKEV